MTENKGCWNCVKAVHITKGGQYQAIICKDQLGTDITDLKDMTGEVCDKWERKWRDKENCPFFKATEYDVNGDRDEICMFDDTICECLGCHKGEGYSEDKIKHHIAIISNYSVIVGDERRAKANNLTFDEYMEYRKSMLEKEKSEYKKYLQELKDIENL